MLHLEGISHWFASTGIQALDGIDLAVERGSVHAIVGENGAGKSTLARIVAGQLAAASGSVWFGGKRLPPGRVDHALASGIALVSQYPALADGFTLFEDAMMGASRGVFLRKRALREDWDRIICEMGIALNGDTPVAEASAAERQLARLAGFLMRDLRCLILDEVSAVLDKDEREALHALVRRLAAAGTSVLLVSHLLDEVIALADNTTILCRGRLVETVGRGTLSADELAGRLFGRFEADDMPLPDSASKAPVKTETVLSLSAISFEAPGWPALHDLSFSLESGSITAIAGIRDAGIETLEQLVAGALQPDSGTIAIGVQTFEAPPSRGGLRKTSRVPQMRKAGLAWIAGGRSLSMLPDKLPLSDALVACDPQHYARRKAPFLLDGVRTGRAAARLIREAGLRAKETQSSASLSGGSQRRFAIARELARTARVLLAVEPFQGLDSRSAGALAARFRAWSSGGRAILLLSADLDRLIALADRILALNGGRIVADISLDSPSAKQHARRLIPTLLVHTAACEEGPHA